jgi:hypothetical protein
MTTVYLGGAINGCTDEEANGWRQAFMEQNPGWDYKDPMVRDYRGREEECVQEIVELDKQDIDNCDIGLFNAWQPSAGTSMEVYYAWTGRYRPRSSVTQRVVLVIPEHLRISPWYRYHSDVIVPTLAEAARWISQWEVAERFALERISHWEDASVGTITRQRGQEEWGTPLATVEDPGVVYVEDPTPDPPAPYEGFELDLTHEGPCPRCGQPYTLLTNEPVSVVHTYH